MSVAFLAVSLHGQTPPFPQWYLDLGGLGAMPQWYLDRGLPTFDSDQDGLPDWWERKTFSSDPHVFDSHLDKDGDGLSGLEEFFFGSDPTTFSTMGDWWSDKEKRDAGLSATFTVRPPLTNEQWQAWGGGDDHQWHQVTRTNAQGYTWEYADFIAATPPYNDEGGAVDFWLETRLDRIALLTFGDALTTNQIPIRAGKGRIRLRAALGGPFTLELDPAPGTLADHPGATNGHWVCDMKLTPYRPNTSLFTAGDTPPDTQPGGYGYVDALVLTETPTNTIHTAAPPEPPTRNDPPPRRSTRVTGESHGMGGLIRLGWDGWYCIPCGAPPYHCLWPTNGMALSDTELARYGLSATNFIVSIAEAQKKITENWPCICVVTQTVASATGTNVSRKVVFEIGRCGAHTGDCGVENPIYPSHKPTYLATTFCPSIECRCSGGPARYIGAYHSKFHIRNLDHDEEKAEYKAYLHCLGIVYNDETTNLLHFIESFGLDLTNLVKWEVNGKQQTSHILNIGEQPKDLAPKIFRIKMLEKSTGVVWDRFILVVCNRETKRLFDEWYAHYKANKAWLEELSAAYYKLGAGPTTNFFNSVSFAHPEPSGSKLWEKIESLNKYKYYHHDSAWDMRSKPTPGGHGHQACYDANGVLVTKGIRAGTADFGHWANGGHNTFIVWKDKLPSHTDEDVDPFIRALHLDGNPCNKSGFGTDRPAIHEGDHLKNYFECRPSIPNAKPLLAPGTVPTP